MAMWRLPVSLFDFAFIASQSCVFSVHRESSPLHVIPVQTEKAGQKAFEFALCVRLSYCEVHLRLTVG